MSEPDEDPPVTGGRDLPESLVWRPNKLSEERTPSLGMSEGEQMAYEQTKYFATASQRRDAELAKLKAEAAANGQAGCRLGQDFIRRLTDTIAQSKYHARQQLGQEAQAIWIATDVAKLLATELAAQAEEIRRLREALEPLVEIYRREPVAWEFMVANIDLRRAAKAMEQQTTKPKDS
jgi:hypothetical protein